ncbi:hypothetical protein NDU88_006663 [Pleurodeles waltl]|uniref:Uncharacterized protein n=1 Tax=Pleurodeles waltl TaxID=8319 RepID=A0AAV7WEW6_PLEWA|nr:hypothetical protein NDU88_006663 [Pleurodeles waltl]
MSNNNISLQGLTAQQLTDWLEKLSSTQGDTSGGSALNLTRLRLEAEDLIEGAMGTDIIDSYRQAELRHLCKLITNKLGIVHQKLADLAEKYDVEIEKTKDLKRSYRLEFDSKEFENMRIPGMKIHIRELLQNIQTWGALDKWEGRRVKKTDKKKRDSGNLTANGQQIEDPVKILPMMEIPGENFVHVPWSRSDILSFTNDYPRLREKPVELYQQIDRCVKLAKCVFVEGLKPEISQMITSHLICWQEKLQIDEVLQYAKCCSDEIELKQRKIKEKAMVMKIKVTQLGMQGSFPQQQQGNI